MSTDAVAKLRDLAARLDTEADMAGDNERMIAADKAAQAADPLNHALVIAKTNGYRIATQLAAARVRDLIAELEPINPSANVAADTWNANLAVQRVAHTITIHQSDGIVGGMLFRVTCSCGWQDPNRFHTDDHPAGDWETDPGGAAEAAMNAAHRSGQAHVVQATT